MPFSQDVAVWSYPIVFLPFHIAVDADAWIVNYLGAFRVGGYI